MAQNNCRTCQMLLLEKYDLKIDNSSKVQFNLDEDNLNQDNRDVYNITAPFEEDGRLWIAGRVEERESEYSQVYFFYQEGSVWKVSKEMGVFDLQDPFITKINHEFVLGGVEVYKKEGEKEGLEYRTIFYRGSSINNLKMFAKGPDKMKDIRLCQLSKNKILVFTRPQGVVGGRGKIGYCYITDLNQLNEETILNATILENQFIEEEWGGANELHVLKNGKVGVLSHIARFDEQGNRHYYATSFCFDPRDGSYSPMKMIASRSDFSKGESKRSDLVDVIFSGGLIRKENGLAQLYCGVSDAEGHQRLIPDPFLEYEKNN